MNKTFNLLFFIKKSKIKADGTVPIYLRITIDGLHKEISSKRNILPEKWDNKLQKVSGNTEQVKTLNAYLKTLEQEVYEAHHQLMKDKKRATSSILKSKLVGTDQRALMLIPIFQDHNDKVKSLLGLEFAAGTLERYNTSLKHTKEFLLWKYGVTDISIKDIDHAFITEYEYFLRSVRKCSNNTSVKYIKNFKKIISIQL